jgi:hypothetical protein
MIATNDQKVFRVFGPDRQRPDHAAMVRSDLHVSNGHEQ